MEILVYGEIGSSSSSSYHSSTASSVYTGTYDLNQASFAAIIGDSNRDQSNIIVNDAHHKLMQDNEVINPFTPANSLELDFMFIVLIIIIAVIT